MAKVAHLALIFIGIVVLMVVLKTLQTFIRPFFIAIILTLLLMPLIRFCRRKKIPFWLALSASVFALVITFTVLGLLLSGERSELDEQISDEPRDIRNTLNNFELLNQEFEFGENTFTLREAMETDRISTIIANLATTSLSVLGSIFSEILLALIFLLFLIPSHERFIRNVEGDMKRSESKKFKTALLEIEKSIQEYLVTKFIISLMTGVVTGVILYFFGSDFVILFAILTFALNFIPNIGSFVAVAIALIAYAAKFGLILPVLWLGLLLFAIQFLFGSILEPKIAGDKLKLSPLVIILSLFLWYWVWGVVGMMLAIPIMSIIKIVLSKINSTKRFTKFLS